MDDLEYMKAHFLNKDVKWKPGLGNYDLYMKIMDINSLGIVVKVIKIGQRTDAGYTYYGDTVGALQFHAWSTKIFFQVITNVYE